MFPPSISKTGIHSAYLNVQEVVLDHFVPNSTLLQGGHGLIDDQDDDQAMLRDGEGEKEGGRKKSVMVLTGSNASGKSVYGKTLALITYMCIPPLRLCSNILRSDTETMFLFGLIQGSRRLVSTTSCSLDLSNAHKVLSSNSFVPAEFATIGLTDKSRSFPFPSTRQELITHL